MIGATQSQQSPLTQDQQQFMVLVGILKKQRDAEVKLSVVGFLGLGLLGAAAYAIWRRR